MKSPAVGTIKACLGAALGDLLELTLCGQGLGWEISGDPF